MINFLKQKNKNIAKSGFTLIETLVALSIFTVSLLAMILILASSLESTGYAKNKIIASYLAQEGVEYMRNMRDTYVLYEGTNPTESGWSRFVGKISNCPSIGSGCYVYFNDQNLDFADNTQPIIDIDVTECIAGVCPNLFYHASTGKYNYVALGGTDSGFSRSIAYKPDGLNSDELKVISEVSWKRGSQTYKVTFQENLFNWTK